VTKPFAELMLEKPEWTKEVSAKIRCKKEAAVVREERKKKYEEVCKEIASLYSGRHRKAFEEGCKRGQSGVLTTIPTTDSGTAMPGLWWKCLTQLRLGLPVSDLPKTCPDCGCRNSVDHALGGGSIGGCGGARAKRHNEAVVFVSRMAQDAKLHVVEGEPMVPKLHPDDPETRCDGIIRGLLTPQRETWIDIEVVDTGAVSHLMEKSEETLEKAEKEKRRKHAPRLLATNRDFIPIVASVHGTTAFDCQHTIKTCTKLMMGSKSEDKAEFAHLLHLNRARFQAAVWRATALCLVGRRGKTQEAACEHHEKEKHKTPSLPWACVTSDAGIDSRSI
jgi:hypothetical protein